MFCLEVIRELNRRVAEDGINPHRLVRPDATINLPKPLLKCKRCEKLFKYCTCEDLGFKA